MAQCNEYPSIKAGETLSMLVTYTDGAGDPISLTGKTITSQIRTQSLELLDDLMVTIADQTTNTGQFTLSATDEMTSAWPIGSLIFDVKIVQGSTVIYSDTGRIDIKQAVTA